MRYMQVFGQAFTVRHMQFSASEDCSPKGNLVDWKCTNETMAIKILVFNDHIDFNIDLEQKI